MVTSGWEGGVRGHREYGVGGDSCRVVKSAQYKIYCFNYFKVSSLGRLSTFALMCKHHYHPSLEQFSTFQTETLYPVNCPLPQLLAAPIPYFLCLWIGLFLVLYISGIIQYLSSCVWLISLSMMFSSFIHIAAYVRISFLMRLNSILFYLYTILCLPTYQSRLSWFLLLAIMNNATVSMYIQISELLLSIPF